MKRSITLLFLVALSGLSFGSVINEWHDPFAYCPTDSQLGRTVVLSRFESGKIEVEIYKDTLPTLPELKYFRSILPQQADWFNNAIASLRWRQDCFTRINLFFRVDYSHCFSDYKLTTPSGEMIPLDYITLSSWASKPLGISVGSFFFDEIKAAFPAGDYTISAVYTDGTPVQKSFTLPPYESDFLPIEAATYWENNRLKMQFPSVADANQSYKIDLNDLKTFQEVWTQTIELNHSETATFDFDSLVQKGKGSYEIYAEAKMLYEDINADITLTSARHWLITPKPLPAIQDKFTKCTVSANARNVGALTFSGQLKAIEADFYNADRVRMTISVDARQDPISVEFPVNAATLKNGKFNGTLKDSDSKAVALFRFDSYTHAFAFSLRNFDLTGLACPITVDITVGDDYTTQIVMDENIVNGTKTPCPPQLLMGVKDTLALTKSKVVNGKIPNTDILTAQGYFTAENLFDENGQFVLTLDMQTFTVPRSQFKFKNGIYSCTNTPVVEGGLLTAKFNTNKATFSLSLKKSTIPKSGLTDFNLNLFGCDLSGLSEIKLAH